MGLQREMGSSSDTQYRTNPEQNVHDVISVTTKPKAYPSLWRNTPTDPYVKARGGISRYLTTTTTS